MRIILLYITAATRAIAGARSFRGRRDAGQDRWHAVEDGLSELVPRTLARIILFEPRMLACLLSWPTHRTFPPGRAFRYDASLRALIWVVIALVIVEGAVVDLILAVAVPGSIWVWIALSLHVYGAVWLLGFLASVATRPHLLDEQALRLRDGIFSEMTIPYDAVLTAEEATHPNFGRSALKTGPAEHSALLAYGDANVTLTLDPTIPVRNRGPRTHAATHPAVDRGRTRHPGRGPPTTSTAHGDVCRFGDGFGRTDDRKGFASAIVRRGPGSRRR